MPTGRQLDEGIQVFCLKGNLDMKYLATRYQNGKAFTERYLTNHNRYVELPGGLSDAHGDLLKIQTEQGAGSNAFLGAKPV